MIFYNNKEYSSKTEVVRELYLQGKITISASDKKKIANELQITVQTVHATIQKLLPKLNSKKDSSIKITPAVEQAIARLNQKMGRVLSSEGPIFISDKSEEVQEELMKRKDKIAILNSPNQWGMPVTNPPMYVIDPNYDPKWVPEPDVVIERSW